MTLPVSRIGKSIETGNTLVVEQDEMVGREDLGENDGE